MTSRPCVSSLALLICLSLCAASRPAQGQTRIYVGGDAFAEITRLSRTTVTPEQLVLLSGPGEDGVAAGGGARIGAFFSPEWSLELGVDLGRTISHAQTDALRVPVGLILPFPAPQFESRSSTRFSAASVLAGYHPPARGRVHTGFRGGVSLMHTVRTSSTPNLSAVTFPSFPLERVTVPTLFVPTTELRTIGNGLTATIAAEAAIDVSQHFAVVPEMRVHAGGLGGFVLRPGAAARWLW